MSDVDRLEQLKMIERLNELERVVPIYRSCLEKIAGKESGVWGSWCRDALNEADRGGWGKSPSRHTS